MTTTNPAPAPRPAPAERGEPGLVTELLEALKQLREAQTVGCPFHTAREWRGVQSRPTEWAEAVAVDEAIRRLPRIKGEAYLHRSLKPLPMVDFRTEQERGQLDLFSCSPFGCVTGEAA